MEQRVAKLEQRVDDICSWRDLHESDQSKTMERIFDKLDRIINDYSKRPPVWVLPLVSVLTALLGTFAGALYFALRS